MSDTSGENGTAEKINGGPMQLEISNQDPVTSYDHFERDTWPDTFRELKGHRASRGEDWPRRDRPPFRRCKFEASRFDGEFGLDRDYPSQTGNFPPEQLAAALSALRNEFGTFVVKGNFRAYAENGLPQYLRDRCKVTERSTAIADDFDARTPMDFRSRAATAARNRRHVSCANAGYIVRAWCEID
ncbi:hypothetical protein KM043_000663 [Ampulex compressa]|nr:hypothetical protein KM043_000663 [Ampulex compressa]